MTLPEDRLTGDEGRLTALMDQPAITPLQEVTDQTIGLEHAVAILAKVKRGSTTSPFRFSINACPK